METPPPDPAEIAELKARLARLESAPAPLPPAPPPASRGGCSTALIWVFAIVAGLVVIASLAGRSDSGSSSNPASAPAPCNQAWASMVASDDMGSGLVVGQDVTAREGVIIIVRLARWNALGFDGQQTMAAVFDCGISGPGGFLREIHFRTQRSGADLYGATAEELLRLRERGLAKGP